MNATEWTALIVAAIGALGAVVLQGLQMWLSYKRDLDTKAKAEEAAIKAEAVKVKVESVVAKIDENTEITTQAKDAASNFKDHSEACTQDLREHDARIAALEGQMAVLHSSVDTVSKNIDNTRHEMRTNIQTVMNKLDTMMLLAKTAETKGPGSN